MREDLQRTDEARQRHSGTHTHVSHAPSILSWCCYLPHDSWHSRFPKLQYLRVPTSVWPLPFPAIPCFLPFLFSLPFVAFLACSVLLVYYLLHYQLKLLNFFFLVLLAYFLLVPHDSLCPCARVPVLSSIPKATVLVWPCQRSSWTLLLQLVLLSWCSDQSRALAPGHDEAFGLLCGTAKGLWVTWCSAFSRPPKSFRPHHLAALGRLPQGLRRVCHQSPAHH